MRNLILFLHLAAAIFWMGGMAFMVLAMRPALHAHLDAAHRLPVAIDAMKRFFIVVAVSIAVLLATGVWLLLQVPGREAPTGWHVMSGLGVLMMLIFAHIVAAPFRKARAHATAKNWLEAGRHVHQVTLLAKINLGIGWLAIAAVMLWR